MAYKSKPQRYWSKDEEQFLKDNYFKKSFEQIAKILNRSPSSIKNHSHVLQLYKKRVRSRITQIKPLSETEKAYIAAFLDGEGYISVRIRYNNKGIPFSVIPVVGITNSDTSVINWIASLANWGKWKGKGSYRQKSRARSFIKKPKICYTVCICGRFRIQSFLSTIFPYLRIKKAAAKAVLEFYQSHGPRSLYSLNSWKKALEVRELTDSRKNQNVESRQRLAQFIKELERKEQNQ